MASVRALDQTAHTAARVLGWEGDGEQDRIVWAAASTAWGLIEGATRGRGCPVELAPTTDPSSEAELLAIARAGTASRDLAAVALSVTLRVAVHYGTAGFTLAEQVVLNRYRQRVR